MSPSWTWPRSRGCLAQLAQSGEPRAQGSPRGHAAAGCPVPKAEPCPGPGVGGWGLRAPSWRVRRPLAPYLLQHRTGQGRGGPTWVTGVRALVEQGYGARRRPWLVSLGLPDVESPRAKWGWGCGALLCFLLWCLRREGHLRLLVCGAGGGDLHTWGLDPPPLLPVPLTAPFSRVEQAPQEQLSGHGVSHQALMKLGTGASSLGCAPCGFGGSLGRAQGGPRTKP